MLRELLVDSVEYEFAVAVHLTITTDVFLTFCVFRCAYRLPPCEAISSPLRVSLSHPTIELSTQEARTAQSLSTT